MTLRLGDRMRLIPRGGFLGLIDGCMNGRKGRGIDG